MIYFFQVWFQNRRAKFRRNERSALGSRRSPNPPSSSIPLTPCERPIPPRIPPDFSQNKPQHPWLSQQPSNPPSEQILNLNMNHPLGYYQNEYIMNQQHHNSFITESQIGNYNRSIVGSAGVFGSPGNSSSRMFMGHYGAYPGSGVPVSGHQYNVNCGGIANWRLRELGLNAMQF